MRKGIARPALGSTTTSGSSTGRSTSTRSSYSNSGSNSGSVTDSHSYSYSNDLLLRRSCGATSSTSSSSSNTISHAVVVVLSHHRWRRTGAVVFVVVVVLCGVLALNNAHRSSRFIRSTITITTETETATATSVLAAATTTTKEASHTIQEDNTNANANADANANSSSSNQYEYENYFEYHYQHQHKSSSSLPSSSSSSSFSKAPVPNLTRDECGEVCRKAWARLCRLVVDALEGSGDETGAERVIREWGRLLVLVKIPFLATHFKSLVDSSLLTDISAALSIASSNNNSNSDNDNDNSGEVMVELSWNKVAKHQVSPANFPRSLLKIVLVEGAGKALTFQLSERSELERVRKEINDRLKVFHSQHTSLMQSFETPAKSTNGGTKRKWNGTSLFSNSNGNAPGSNGNGNHHANSSLLATGNTTTASYGELDPTSMAVTRSSLLASNPTLRSQHKYLVEESQTVSEEDFWTTHASLLEEEYARISGITRAGTSSLLQSHLQVLTGRITLGVEEMRQIFIMYPAVHKAYDEKVPLELSDEQFWRKYLESEYFHRDRGRVGAASGWQHAANQNKTNGEANTESEKRDKQAAANAKDQAARAAVVAADDLFSRYDQKLRESGQLDDGVFSGAAPGSSSDAAGSSGNNGMEDNNNSNSNQHKRRKWGSHLAIGQFDLASTFETERGNLLEGPKDNHPHYNIGEDTIGAKVIQKYNRHWAMVLNPEEAVAGSNLMEVARHSVRDAIPNDQDAMAGGGWDDEMQRLVGFAMASAENANHALGIGESDEYETLTLKNVDVYYNKGSNNAASAGSEKQKEDAKREQNRVFANLINIKMKKTLDDYRVKHVNRTAASMATQLEDAFPPPLHGRRLMAALTKRMQLDSKTDADTLEVVNSLPVEFKKRLHSYFRRASELLRHFFGLRKLAQEVSEDGDGDANNAYKQKLEKIKNGLRTLHGEIDAMRNEQEVTSEIGKTMAEMCKQIMDQLNWAFKSSEEGKNSGFTASGRGGFTTVERF
mmetsp:Transcript_24503/g.50548  ORF Transcript_24503/g.50548 Transcript_24503/m.50548 type:complete len:1009 (-) Transcript_24503:944-3970(-)